MDSELITELSKTLGAFRAENLGDNLFSLYTAPAYFPQLLTPIPCLLQGGRGTGKTTVLKSLSYEGQYRLSGNNFDGFLKKQHIGIYYKLETALVSAFAGAGKDDGFWQPVFSHFVNLQLCKLLCDFAIWQQEKQGYPFELNRHQLQTFCVSIGLKPLSDLNELRNELDLAIAYLESDINYAADPINSKHSPIGAPTRRLVNLLRATQELNGKTFYFLLDEYENLRDYQQSILNTFIKQADSELTFKIGIKELGLKTRHTLNPNEQLVDPADYVLIDISKSLSENEFDSFSQNVLDYRFQELRSKDIKAPGQVTSIFEDLTEEEEATKLGAAKIAAIVRETISFKGTSEELRALSNFSNRELALLQFFSDGNPEILKKGVYEEFKEAVADAAGWKNKINNYGYAGLFAIRKKKVGINKYYSGWKTILSLSAGNIRYLLQLVTNSLIQHTKDGKTFDQEISAECQTDVAMEVGKKNLMELEGLSTRGAQLMKLVLGIGQVLHEMAIQPEGHAPEITQFEISTKFSQPEEAIAQVNEILHAAVMHLALVRTSGTKLGGPGDTRDFDYMLHPIFSAFFVYSQRRKRKFPLSPEELIGIISNTSNTIKSILVKHNRIGISEFPEQLRLFGGFYEGNS